MDDLLETQCRSVTRSSLEDVPPLVVLGQGPTLRLIREEDVAAWHEARASGALVGMLLMLAFGWLMGLVTAWAF